MASMLRHTTMRLRPQRGVRVDRVIVEARADRIDGQPWITNKQASEGLDVSVLNGALPFHFQFQTGPRSVSITAGERQLGGAQVEPAGQPGQLVKWSRFSGSGNTEQFFGLSAELLEVGELRKDFGHGISLPPGPAFRQRRRRRHKGLR